MVLNVSCFIVFITPPFLKITFPLSVKSVKVLIFTTSLKSVSAALVSCNSCKALPACSPAAGVPTVPLNTILFVPATKFSFLFPFTEEPKLIVPRVISRVVSERISTCLL